MDVVTALKERLDSLGSGVTILNEALPNGIHFTIDHAVVARSLLFDLILNHKWWVLSRLNSGKVKEYKVANYKPAW